MTDPADETRIEHRSHLLPEEAAVGSDDPEAQAEAILADSDDRTERRRRRCANRSRRPSKRAR